MSELKGLPTLLNRDLRRALLACGPFDSSAELRSVFNDAALYAWRNQIPASGDRQALVDETITLLYNNPFDHPNPLVRFLYVLADQTGGEGCREELTRVADEVSAYLGEEGVTLEEVLGITGGESVSTNKGGTEVGERGVNVGGNVQGDIITGDQNTVFNQQGQKVSGPQTNIAGDANIGQIGDNVDTRGGDFVRGDQYNIDKISGGAVAIGPGAKATQISGKEWLSPAEMEQLFLPLLNVVTQSAPAGQQQVARYQVQALQKEAAKGQGANDNKMASLIQDIADVVPEANEELIDLFNNTVLAELAGSTTQFVIGRLGR